MLIRTSCIDIDTDSSDMDALIFARDILVGESYSSDHPASKGAARARTYAKHLDALDAARPDVKAAMDQIAAAKRAAKAASVAGQWL